MHIKVLRLFGFKTYNELTEVVFSPTSNCIVGKNGSGKSNILDAITFVICSLTYGCAGPAKRKAIFHEGASVAVKNAYVEIVLDNSDRSISMYKKSEVSLKRVITEDKDELFIDSKKCTKRAFEEILECSGLYRLNAYNIVRQGKVVEIGIMSDEKRLELLHDVAGVRAYDQRRADCVKLITGKDEELLTADETLKTVMDQMEVLEKEQEELMEYQSYERKLRTVNFVLCSRELNEAKSDELDAIKKLEDIKNDEVKAERQLDILKDLVDSYKNDHSKKKRCLEVHEALKKSKSEALWELKSEQNRLLLEENDLLKSCASAAEAKRIKASRLQSLKEEARIANGITIKGLLNECERLEKELCLIKDKRIGIETQLSQHYAKTYNNNNQEQRKHEITVLVQNLKKENEETTSRLHSLEEEEKEMKVRLSGVEEKIRITESELEKIEQLLRIKRNERAVCRERIETTVETKTKLQSDIVRQSIINEDSALRVNRLDGLLMRNISANNRRALKDAEKWKEQNHVEVPGILLNNIVVPSYYMVAIEAISGIRLFNYLVNNKHEMQSLAMEIKNNKSGKITIVPVAEVNEQFKAPSYPSKETSKFFDRLKPVVECIKYEKQIEGVMYQVFGNFLLVDTLETARKLAEEGWKFSFVTVEGDTYSHDHSVAGGFVTTETLKLQLNEELRKESETLTRAKKELLELGQKLEANENTLLHLEQKEAFLIKEEASLIDQKHLLLNEISRQKHFVNSESLNLSNLNQKQKNFHSSLLFRKKPIEELEETMKKPVLGPSAKDKKVISNLEAQLVDLQQQQEKAATAYKEVETNLMKERARVSEVVIPAIENIEIEIQNDQEDEENRLEELQKQIAINNHKKIELEEAISSVNDTVSDCLKQLEESTDLLTSVTHELEIMQLECEEFLSAKEQLQKAFDSKRDTKKALEIKISSTGGVATDFDVFELMNNSDLRNLRIQIGRQLKSLKNVNLKASEQYHTFKEQFQHLTERRQTLRAANEAILGLIETIDKSKGQLVKSTLEKLNAVFFQTFSELVPGGTAELVEVKSDFENTYDTPDSIVPRNDDDVFGIEVRVAFGHQKKVPDDLKTSRTLQQLSGGQKTIVSLALIFAIQAVNPAPFYLFDEVDAALDDQYRAAVAEQIRKISSNSQFILTTFRPELLNVSDRHFLVSMENRCSDIKIVSEIDAYKCIQKENINEDPLERESSDVRSGALPFANNEITSKA